MTFMTLNALKKHQSLGIGILEMMLALAVIAMIVIFSVRYYSVVQTQATVNQILSDLKEIRNGTKEWATATPNWDNGSMSMDMLANEEYISRRLVGPQPGIYNATYRAEIWSSNYLMLYLSPLPYKICNATAQKYRSMGGEVGCGGNQLSFRIYLPSI